MPIIANFGGGGGVSKTDETLTKPGLPADAKATGEALDNIKKYAGSIIQISDMEPTDPNTEIWINPYEDGEMSAGGGVAVQADWNENDESKPPFVKGRTHWKEEFPGKDIILETTKTFGGNTVLSGAKGSLTDGEEYIVAWNGKEYACVCHGNYVGNKSLTSGGGDDTGEPFYISNISGTLYQIIKANSASESITLSVKTPTKVIYHKLDPEFMPDGVPYIISATVGQTIVVSEVDAEGKPTKWEGVDLPDNSGSNHSGVAASAVSGHNQDDKAHQDIRAQIETLSNEKADQSDLDDLKVNGVQQVPLFAESVEGCTDTSKVYVLPDGFIYAYKFVEATGPSYTNLAGTVTYDKRLSSSGKVSSSAMVGAAYTDFIPVKKGQKVRIKNFDVFTDFTSSSYPYICFYTGPSESKVVSQGVYDRPSWLKMNTENMYQDSDGTWVYNAFRMSAQTGVVSVDSQHPLADTITHIRISGHYETGKEIIITVDEEITEGTGGGGCQWVNTGHAFVPADYEERILDLEAHAEAIPESRIKAIENALDEPNPADYSGNILYGKKWVACGDSFTANGYNASDGFDESVYIYQDGRFAGRYKVYPNIIGLRNNMSIVNKASGGQTMGQSSNSFMNVYQTIDADADYITIMLGINDKLQGIPVGAAEDSTNATFCGCYNIAMEHILENHPFAHIGIMVSHGTNAEIMAATRQIAERWGVPYLDYGSPQVPLMNRYTGRNVCAKAQEIREKNFCVVSDGVNPTNSHPNTAAHEFESTFIEAWLRTL